MRVTRTQRSIKEAFLRLLAEKKYENITVQEIVNRAYVNRNTFYLHYIDKADLFEKYCTECLNEFEASLGDRNFYKLDDNFLYCTLKDVLNTIEKNKNFYKIMMVESDSSYFTERLAAILKKRIITSIGSRKNDFAIEFINTGFIGMIRMYLREDTKVSKEEFSDIIFKFLHENLLKFLTKN